MEAHGNTPLSHVSEDIVRSLNNRNEDKQIFHFPNWSFT